MESPTGIIPEELMYPSKLGDVMTFLKNAPIKGQRKLDLFLGWARTVGVRVQQSQRNAVMHSGIDYPAPPERGEV